MPMEVIYDVFEIPVPISSPVPEVRAPRKLRIPLPTNTKIGETGKYQEEETIMSRPPKEEVLSKIFMGKLAQKEVL